MQLLLAIFLTHGANAHHGVNEFSTFQFPPAPTTFWQTNQWTPMPNPWTAPQAPPTWPQTSITRWPPVKNPNQQAEPMRQQPQIQNQQSPPQSQNLLAAPQAPIQNQPQAPGQNVQSTPEAANGNSGGGGAKGKATYHEQYNAGFDSQTVACSGKLKEWGYKDLSAMFPYVVSRFGQAQCGQCYKICSTKKCINVTNIDLAGTWDLSREAFDEVGPSSAFADGSFEITYTKVAGSQCRGNQS